MSNRKLIFRLGFELIQKSKKSKICFRTYSTLGFSNLFKSTKKLKFYSNLVNNRVFELIQKYIIRT